MRTELFNYELPEELIAQIPQPRGLSRLMVIDRSSGSIEHRRFTELPNLLKPADTLVLNDTRVTGRRLTAQRQNGLDAEVLLIAPIGERAWHALVRPGRALRPGTTLTLVGPNQVVSASVIDETSEGGRVIELPSPAWRDDIANWGHIPLPPYIHFTLNTCDEERYQTVYGCQGGSAAAPTAGLHFTTQMLDEIARAGVKRAAITLQVGVGTFRPVRSEQIVDHTMHSESVTVTAEAATAINTTSGRVVAVGTTTVRALESASDPTNNYVHSEPDGERSGITRYVRPFSGETNLFITPGYTFRTVDALITNFHQPKSTLLMMVSAFAGCDLIREAYQIAIQERYRFFSFGDAMMIM